MLQSIRDRAQGWLAWVIVAFISVPFALWGIQEYFGTGVQTGIAEVNGKEIPLRGYERTYQSERQRLQSSLGLEQFRSQYSDETVLKKTVLQKLVNSEILAQVAFDAGYAASDAQVAATLNNVGRFQRSGIFSQDAYRAYLGREGKSAAGFEIELRRDLIIDQLQKSIMSTAFVTDRDVAEFVRLLRQTRSISHLTFPLTRYMSDIEISDAEITAYYGGHRDEFREPERVVVEYVELSADTLGQDSEPTAEERQTLYDEMIDSFGIQEQRHARHILIALEPGLDAAGVVDVVTKADKLLTRLHEGEDFAALAKEYSDDSGSAMIGGDLGFFGRGAMVGEFEESVFSLAVGERSGLVQSEFGFHIIELVEIQASRLRSIDEVGYELTTEHKRRVGADRFYDMGEELANLGYENPESLDLVVSELGLELKTSSAFARDVADNTVERLRQSLEFGEIAANAKVATLAYSDDVLQEGNNSEVIELTPSHLMMLRVAERIADRALSEDEVREQILSRLVSDMSRTAAAADGHKALERLTQGETWSKVSADFDAVPSDSILAVRTASSPDTAIVSTAFKLPRSTAGDAAVYGSAVIGDGDFVVVRVDKVIDGVVDEKDKGTMDYTATQMLEMLRRVEFDQALLSFKDRFEVIVFDEFL